MGKFLFSVVIFICLSLSNVYADENIVGKNNLVKTIYNSSKTADKKGNYGGYNKDLLKVLWLNDGRKAKLLETLSFIDPKGKKWIAPKGHIIDGASIPVPFQPIVGTPYGGKYVMASVIHDVACDEKKLPWKEVHKVFHFAMLASGVSKEKANLMYQAVYLGGPRWGKDAEKRLTEVEFKKLINGGKFQQLANDFGANKMNIKSLSTWGKLKEYEGTLIYAGLRNGKSTIGAITKFNDITFKVEKQKAKAAGRITYAKDRSKYGVSYHSDKNKNSSTLGFQFGSNSEHLITQYKSTRYRAI